MAAPVSTIPAVKAWLYGQLQTACTAATGIDLLVRYGEPGPFQPEDVVSIGAAINRAAAPFGIVGSLDVANSMIETYELEIDIDITRNGEDVAQATTERAYTLAAQVEEVVRATPTLGGHVTQSRPMSSNDRSEWTDDGWFNVTVTLAIYCEAVI